MRLQDDLQGRDRILAIVAIAIGQAVGAQHAARRAVKGGEYTIAGRLDLTAAIAREVAADRGVMIVEKIPPAAVPSPNGALAVNNVPELFSDRLPRCNVPLVPTPLYGVVIVMVPA